jgi:6-phosphogluconate dehydrogenase
MELAMVGLGKMGLNMATRLARGGHRVIGFARTDTTVQEAIKLGAEGAYTLEEAVSKLKSPRIVWLMIPAGKVTHDSVQQLSTLLSPGDIVIDGGNSNYKDSVLHAAMLEPKGIEFVDCGTSGGIWGLTEGYSLMIGGKPEVVEKLHPIFETLAPAPDKGWGHVGPHGAGHYVKMVHNGIEYGMMQAFAEGFSILKAKKEFNMDLAQISHIWQHGSVVRSWLLDLVASALSKNASLDGVQPFVADSGEGRWTVAEAVDLNVPAPVITLALQARLRSRVEESFADRLLAVLREEFGGHAVRRDPA